MYILHLKAFLMHTSFNFCQIYVERCVLFVERMTSAASQNNDVLRRFCDVVIFLTVKWTAQTSRPIFFFKVLRKEGGLFLKAMQPSAAAFTVLPTHATFNTSRVSKTSQNCCKTSLFCDAADVIHSTKRTQCSKYLTEVWKFEKLVTLSNSLKIEVL